MPPKHIPVKGDASANYFEMKMHMESGAMQDEINQMVINGMKISIINGKVGIRCDYVRIYDYSNNLVISRFRKDSFAT